MCVSWCVYVCVLRAAAVRAFPAWECMEDVRGGAKRADSKGGALNDA